jgi:hypothetical protein
MVGCKDDRCQTEHVGKGLQKRKSYDEEREGVQRQAGGVEGKAVQPALWVLQGLDHVLPGEALVVGGVAVCGETRADEFALVVGKEGRCVWVVLYEPVGGEADEESGDALLCGS